MKSNKFFIVLMLVLTANIAFAANEGKVGLIIIPPEYDGGYQLEEYHVEYKNIKEKNWKLSKKVPVVMKAKDKNGNRLYENVYYEAKELKIGESYVFRVRAKNIIGVGNPGTETEKILVKEDMSSGYPVISGDGLSKGKSISPFNSFYFPLNQTSTVQIPYRPKE